MVVITNFIRSSSNKCDYSLVFKINIFREIIITHWHQLETLHKIRKNMRIRYNF